MQELPYFHLGPEGRKRTQEIEDKRSYAIFKY